MSKKIIRGGTIMVDKDGNQTVVTPPTKMATSGDKKITKKSDVKNQKNKGEK